MKYAVRNCGVCANSGNLNRVCGYVDNNVFQLVIFVAWSKAFRCESCCIDFIYLSTPGYRFDQKFICWQENNVKYNFYVVLICKIPCLPLIVMVTGFSTKALGLRIDCELLEGLVDFSLDMDLLFRLEVRLEDDDFDLLERMWRFSLSLELVREYRELFELLSLSLLFDRDLCLRFDL